MPPVNKGMIDKFSLVHGASGASARMAGVGRGVAYIGALLFELVETPLKNRYPSFFPSGTSDTLANATGDMLAFILGYEAADPVLSSTRGKWALPIFIGGATAMWVVGLMPHRAQVLERTSVRRKITS